MTSIARRRAQIALFVTTLVALLINACSNNGSPAPRDYGEIGGPSGTELAAAQVLHKDNGAEPQTLDPHRATGVPEGNILRDLYEPLVMEAPDGTLIPGAASGWQISADGLRYLFTLRPEGRWSNGDPVTAHDFIFSLRRAVDPATLSGYASILYPIANAEEINNGLQPVANLGVRAVDDYTLEILLRGPTPYFTGLLNHSMAYAVHPPSVQEHGERFARAGNLVGNGAYVLKDWVVQSHIELVRNEKFRDNDSTTIDTVFYHALENSDAVFKRYRADEIDLTQGVPSKQLEWIRTNMADEYRQSTYLGSYYYGLNVTREPFKGQPGLRRALSMAIDREIITEKLSGAGEQPAYGWIPPVQGYEPQRPEWADWSREQRHAEARRLYTEAGYGDDNPLVVEILYNTSQDHKRIAIAISSMWKQVLGVETRLLNQEWKVFLQTRATRFTTQAFRAGWIGDYNDAYTFAELMYSNNEQNDSGWVNADYDRLLNDASMERDLQKRALLMQEAERILLFEAPIIPIYFYVSKHLVKPWVGGFVPNIMDHVYTKDLYILKH
ncbi:MAG: peptide ABC transporter substrate-binding protein [Gammaproteobacteria bacterium]|nr:peptide ABC transporter substrate-binding protein [Gammaproteobacteria bacterium]MDP6616895.1 peptide ABC transporter substrate-binding protein [Gammaproteobacteria bacterium]MDP6694545.1 peptide ABC transporter substrate-binding protein [Gammaproteobacteria bacterium]MDP7041399.1 peptide ABC transporter substrate-binding protein [Gammaproteobacteria bacterium]